MEPSASSGLSDLAEALGALPLFPLPHTVLFPGVLMPLHVFEPRYRAMVRDVLETHRSLAVVLIKNAEVKDAHAHAGSTMGLRSGEPSEARNPEIASVAGVGTIVDHVELPGGRYNILLRGRARVRLDELPFVPPYRRARAEVLVAPRAEPSQKDLAALVSSATAFAAFVKARERTFDFRLPQGASASVIADVCAHHLVLDANERQRILETLDPSARVRRVAEALAVQKLALGPPARNLN